MNPTRTTPSCYNNTTLNNRLYAWHKGPNITNPICWKTCKNCHITVMKIRWFASHNATFFRVLENQSDICMHSGANHYTLCTRKRQRHIYQRAVPQSDCIVVSGIVSREEMAPRDLAHQPNTQLDGCRPINWTQCAQPTIGLWDGMLPLKLQRSVWKRSINQLLAGLFTCVVSVYTSKLTFTKHGETNKEWNQWKNREQLDQRSWYN